MANSRDFTGKNRKFTGTKGIVMPKGSTAERADTESGEIRFNTTTELMEYYDGNQWKPIDAPPTISSVSTGDSVGDDAILNADGSTLYTITITGGNFGIGAVVKFIGNTGTEYTAGNVNRVSGSTITCTTVSNMGTTDDPYDVQVTNASGLAALLEDAFSYNAAPVFVNASGQLGTVYDGQTKSGSSLNASATDAEGNTITYSIISGSLPGSGLTLSSSTGLITGTLSGTPSLGNYPFVVQAATTEGTISRQFSIGVIAVPTYSVEFLVIAGGGGGSGNNGGNGGGGAGGAGGYRTSTQTVTATRTITVTVGNGGTGSTGATNQPTQGSSSSISGTGLSTITSAGGGFGGDCSFSPARGGGNGGSGGGEGNGVGPFGNGNTPSTVPSQGNNGGQGWSSTGGGAPHYPGAGGGGAGAVGGNAIPGSQTAGTGGNGVASSITGSSVTRAGGGGGGTYSGGTAGGGGTGGGGAGGTAGGNNPGTSGVANTGGGGGNSSASGAPGNSTGGSGGKGVVILRMATSNYSGTTTGSPTVTTDGSDTILQFNGDGSYAT